VSTDADVIVVGAGPVGLVTALLLARRGWSSHIVERHPQPYGRPRAIALDPETVRLFQRMDLLDEILPISDHTDYYDWFGADGELLLRFDRSGLAAPGWNLQICNQPMIEAILERRAEESPLVSITRGVEAVDINDSGGDVAVRLGHPRTGADMGVLTGRFVVGADGANSRVRQHIGSPVSDLTFFYDWLIVDVIPHVERDWGNSSIQLCTPERPTTVVPAGAGRRRWEFMVMPGEDPAAVEDPDFVWNLLAPWELTPENAEIERSAVYTFRSLWLEQWVRGRVALAGDAAHLMPPFAGQGLNSGLRDAVNLTWKLDLVLSGRAPIGVLESYSLERSEHVQHAIQFSVELGKVICVLDWDEARERDRRMLAHKGDPATALPQLPAAAFSRGIVADPPGGTLAPQFFVTAPGSDVRERFDDVIDATEPFLLTRTAVDAAARERLATVGGRVVELGVDVVDVDGSYGREFDRIGADAALVRPDGYYFGAGDAAALVADFVALVTSGGSR